MATTLEQRALYWEARRSGRGKGESAHIAGFSINTATRLEKGRHDHTVKAATEAERIEMLRPPIPPKELCKEAQRALEDFGYFQQRYFGRIPLDWQVEAANQIVALEASEDKEYLVLNGPPGSGKTILVTHDIPAWLIVRNRQIRGMFGAATGALAARYNDRLRKTLARTLPEKASDEDLARGLAVDAQATLSGDFGRFQATGDTWTKNAFVVEQYEGQGSISEKEPTWCSYGQDEGFIGGRFDICIWDDLVDPKKQRTVEAKEDLQNYWDDVSEPRLEPSGMLILNGQRMSSDDLYRYCIDKVTGDEEDEDGNLVITGKKYHHMKFMSHYDEKCRGKDTHARDAPAWPEGCLLSPRRLPWTELSAVKQNRADRFEVVYQQGDSDPSSVLVLPDWIFGRNGAPGCVDEDRDRLEIPRMPNGAISLSGDLFSVMTVDPSPTKYWAILWIVYQPSTEYRWVIDLERRFMQADEFLDYDHAHQQFSGLLPEWLSTSRDLGMPITHVIVEANAAQRFMLQYDHIRRWIAKEGVEVVPHTTHKNKSDEEYGVDTIKQHFRFGRYRLPYKRDSQGMFLMRRYIEELTNYPHSRTDDMVMATWFFEWQLPRLYVSEEADGKEWRPSWISTVPDRRRPTGIESARPQLAGRF